MGYDDGRIFPQSQLRDAQEILDAIRERCDIALRRYKTQSEGGTNDGYFQAHGFRVARDIVAYLNGHLPGECEGCGKILVTCENPKSWACASPLCVNYDLPLRVSHPELRT
jgi:hypothetical protein